MPVGQQQEKLFGLPGPQNSAVLMDIITKLKQDLQKSRAENCKLVDQLNCLISLVKRAWSGEQGAVLHLANIVGMEGPSFPTTEMNRNTPMPDKSRAVRNWERFAIRLLEKNYMEIRQEIHERQQAHMMNREQYMNEVLEDHKYEMGKFALHKNSATDIENIDKQFMRCYSAKSNQGRPLSSLRPRSGNRGQGSRAANMAERAEVKVEDILSQQGQAGAQTNGNNNVFNGLYKMSENERLLYRPREQFDDPSRYKQNHLFDPDVIFSPELMSSQGRSRPSSATDPRYTKPNHVQVRPASAVIIQNSSSGRPLKYETTRPVSNRRRPASSKVGSRPRLNSAPSHRGAPTSYIGRKDLHRKGSLDNNRAGNQTDELGYDEAPSEDVDEVARANEAHDDDNDSGERVDQKPPMSVKVKKGHPMDKFVEDLRLMTEMENDFKKSTLQLQKKLGLETSGFV